MLYILNSSYIPNCKWDSGNSIPQVSLLVLHTFFSFFFGGEIKKAYICISKPCCSEIGKLNTKKITGYIGISMAGCAFGYVFATRQITKDTDTPNPVYRSFLNKRQHGLSFFNPLSATMVHIYYIRMAINVLKAVNPNGSVSLMK